MRQNIAQAFPYDPANPQSVEARRPFPNFVRLHRQQLGRQIELQRVQHQARAPRPRFAADVRLHVGEEHRFEIGGRRHRRQRLQRVAGIPQQPRSGARSRAVGLRRQSSTGRELRLQPAVRQRRAVCWRCHGRQERRRRRWQVNGIYTWQRGFPITIQAVDQGGLNDSFNSNRADLVGDPSGRRRRASKSGSTPPPLCSRTRPIRQHRTQHPEGTRRQQPRFLAVQEFRSPATTCSCNFDSSRSTSSTTRSSTGRTPTSRIQLSGY